MGTLKFPDWQAMAQPTEPADTDWGTVSAIRTARIALGRGAMFMARAFEAIDSNGNPKPATDPDAARVIEELAGAHRVMADAIFRLTGKEI